jgi:hypothetical protein
MEIDKKGQLFRECIKEIFDNYLVAYHKTMHDIFDDIDDDEWGKAITKYEDLREQAKRAVRNKMTTSDCRYCKGRGTAKASDGDYISACPKCIGTGKQL